MDILKFISDVGFPIASACVGFYFVYLTLKFILEGVSGSVKGLSGIIMALDRRVATMNHDILRIDVLISNALQLKPDVDRIARAEQSDARRD